MMHCQCSNGHHAAQYDYELVTYLVSFGHKSKFVVSIEQIYSQVTPCRLSLSLTRLSLITRYLSLAFKKKPIGYDTSNLAYLRECCWCSCPHYHHCSFYCGTMVPLAASMQLAFVFTFLFAHAKLSVRWLSNIERTQTANSCLSMIVVCAIKWL